MEMIKALLLPLLTILLLASSAIATVEEVCKTASSSGHVNFNFCVSTLSSVPGSGSATNHGLAVIAATLSLNQATSLKSKVDSLLKSTSDPKLKVSLLYCVKVFDGAISALTEVTDAIKRGKNARAVRQQLIYAVDASTNCEHVFKPLPSPVFWEDDVLHQLANIALSITNHLHE